MTTQNSGVCRQLPGVPSRKARALRLSGDSVEPRAEHEVYHKFQILRAKSCGYLWSVLAGISMKEHPQFLKVDTRTVPVQWKASLCPQGPAFQLICPY